MTTVHLPLAVGSGGLRPDVEAAAVAANSEWFELWSVLVAAVAALLALASLLTQLREIYWSRPVIVLDGSLKSSTAGWDADILVTNVGERAVTITRTGWWCGFGTHYEDVREANSFVRLPHRLEPHDTIAFRGRISVENADWTRVNGGLFKRASASDSASSGAWRDDELPDHNQYADPFVEIVRRPRNVLVRLVLSRLKWGMRKLMWRTGTLILQGAWWRLVRQDAPRGHARVWGEPQIIWAPTEGL